MSERSPALSDRRRQPPSRTDTRRTGSRYCRPCDERFIYGHTATFLLICLFARVNPHAETILSGRHGA